MRPRKPKLGQQMPQTKKKHLLSFSQYMISNVEIHNFNGEGITVLLIPERKKDVKRGILCLPQMTTLLGLPRHIFQQLLCREFLSTETKLSTIPCVPLILPHYLLVSLCALNTHVHICTQIHMYNTHTKTKKLKRYLWWKPYAFVFWRS